MSWMSVLCKTYDANLKNIGNTDYETPLSPVAHMVANAQIEIKIDTEGNLISAITVDKEDAGTIIPVSDKSASRSSGVAPHPLCDMLPYLALDFGSYLTDPKQIKTTEEKSKAYMEQLSLWCSSEYCHPKVSAIYAYLSNGTIITDLVECGILKLDENGKFAKAKVSGKEYEKAVVRFRVAGSEEEAVFHDTGLFDSYLNYYASQTDEKKDLCYITGTEKAVSTNHPKGIVAAHYGAKLLSANDTSNFVFRGRFATAEEACAVSYEASQKAHKALTWLAANQGISIGSSDKRVFICWNPGGKSVAQFNMLGFQTDDDNDITEKAYKANLLRTLAGYRNDISRNDSIVIIGLDAATTGRLSITYYNELAASDYYDRIEKWYSGFVWEFFKGKGKLQVESPSLRRIVDCAFGTERKTEKSSFLETNDKVQKEQIQRLLYCMLDDKPLPKDLSYYLFCHASTPLAYSRYNRSIILSTACAVIRKNRGDEVKMTLDENNTDRSYLFGRLLAIAEYAEASTYNNSDGDRETNAIRLQAAFVNHPFKTWSNIESELNPYYQKHTAGNRIRLKKMVTDIFALIANEDSKVLNRPLTEDYLLGYYLQKKDLYTSKKISLNNEEETEL